MTKHITIVLSLASILALAAGCPPDTATSNTEGSTGPTTGTTGGVAPTSGDSASSTSTTPTGPSNETTGDPTTTGASWGGPTTTGITEGSSTLDSTSTTDTTVDPASTGNTGTTGEVPSQTCGDGVTQPPEACDDANQDNADECANVCFPPDPWLPSCIEACTKIVGTCHGFDDNMTWCLSLCWDNIPNPGKPDCQGAYIAYNACLAMADCLELEQPGACSVAFYTMLRECGLGVLGAIPWFEGYLKSNGEAKL